MKSSTIFNFELDVLGYAQLKNSKVEVKLHRTFQSNPLG